MHHEESFCNEACIAKIEQHVGMGSVRAIFTFIEVHICSDFFVHTDHPVDHC